jgi:hypothetical protein
VVTLLTDSLSEDNGAITIFRALDVFLMASCLRHGFTNHGKPDDFYENRPGLIFSVHKKSVDCNLKIKNVKSENQTVNLKTKQ